MSAYNTDNVYAAINLFGAVTKATLTHCFSCICVLSTIKRSVCVCGKRFKVYRVVSSLPRINRFGIMYSNIYNCKGLLLISFWALLNSGEYTMHSIYFILKINHSTRSDDKIKETYQYYCWCYVHMFQRREREVYWLPDNGTESESLNICLIT